jgi:hypothetical protein
MLYNHSHNRRWVFFPYVIVLLESILQAHIAYCVAADKNEIPVYLQWKIHCVKQLEL